MLLEQLTPALYGKDNAEVNGYSQRSCHLQGIHGREQEKCQNKVGPERNYYMLITTIPNPLVDG